MKPFAPIAIAGFAALALSAAAGPAQAEGLQLTPTTDANATQVAQDVDTGCDMNLGSTGITAYTGGIGAAAHLAFGSMDFASARQNCYIVPPADFGSVWFAII